VVLKFGQYELDQTAYELRRRGRPVRVERLPMELLFLLVERRGALVTRDQIVARLWREEPFHDLDNGVHTAIRKVRQALHDSAERPEFVQTVSGKGYRFVAQVALLDPRPSSSAIERIAVAVLPFENLTGDPNQDYLSDGLTEETIAALGKFGARAAGRNRADFRDGIQTHTEDSQGNCRGARGRLCSRRHVSAR
jgi:DNA-binding winged helix-turn-helix (wHTH) protein